MGYTQRRAEVEIERLQEQPMWDGYVAQQCATLLRENEELRAEIARLQELLRGVGANRYWEGRWRDERERCSSIADHVRDLLTSKDGNDGAVLVPRRVRDAILGHLAAIRKGE